MKKLEIALVAIAFIAMVLFLFKTPGAAAITVLTVGVLAMFYCYLGFAIYSGVGFRKMFKKESYSEISSSRITGGVLAGIATCFMSLGILFRIMSWPGSMMFSYIGAFGLFIAAIVATVKLQRSKSDYYKSVLARIIPWLVVGSIWMFYKRELVRFRYRNYPAYVKAYENYKENPDNKALLDSLYVEEDKIHQHRSEESEN